MSLLETIEQSRADVRRLAKTVPHIFPEWLRLQHAKRNLAAAQSEVRAAQKEWDKRKKGTP